MEEESKRPSRKAGDWARVRSEEWIRSHGGGETSISSDYGRQTMTTLMQERAGKLVKIIAAENGSYRIDADGELHVWEDWMFCDDFDPGTPLSVREAIQLMAWHNEKLHGDDGNIYYWSDVNGCVVKTGPTNISQSAHIDNVKLRLAPRQPKTRPWTLLEFLAWAASGESAFWFVRNNYGGGNVTEWKTPWMAVEGPDMTLKYMERGLLTADGCGVNVGSIQAMVKIAEEET
jgi:hypothetical protein